MPWPTAPATELQSFHFGGGMRGVRFPDGDAANSRRLIVEKLRRHRGQQVMSQAIHSRDRWLLEVSRRLDQPDRRHFVSSTNKNRRKTAATPPSTSGCREEIAAWHLRQRPPASTSRGSECCREFPSMSRTRGDANSARSAILRAGRKRQRFSGSCRTCPPGGKNQITTMASTHHNRIASAIDRSTRGPLEATGWRMRRSSTGVFCACLTNLIRRALSQRPHCRRPMK